MQPAFRPTLIAGATAVACSLMLAACGGGSGDSSAPPTNEVTQTEATADASNGQQSGSGSASALDDVFDTTQALAVAGASAATASGTSDRARAEAAGTPITNATLDCAGGGTATLSIAGGTLASQLNGQFDAGERYTVVYAQCRGQAGYAQLDGSVELDIVSISTDTTPVTTATLAMTALSVSSSLGSMTLDGAATLARSTSTDGNVTTTTTHVSADRLALATAFNARSGSFALSGVDWTRSVTAIAGVVTGSTFEGHHTLSGNANGFAFSQAVSTTGAVTCDAVGAPVAGQWSTVRPESTLATTLAAGVVTITLDVGSNGSIERTWTFPLAQLDAAAG